MLYGGGDLLWINNTIIHVFVSRGFLLMFCDTLSVFYLWFSYCYMGEMFLSDLQRLVDTNFDILCLIN